MSAENQAAEHAFENHLTSLETVLSGIIASSPFKLTFSIQKAVVHAGDPVNPFDERSPSIR